MKLKDFLELKTDGSGDVVIKHLEYKMGPSTAETLKNTLNDNILNLEVASVNIGFAIPNMIITLKISE